MNKLEHVSPYVFSGFGSSDKATTYSLLLSHLVFRLSPLFMIPLLHREQQKDHHSYGTLHFYIAKIINNIAFKLYNEIR